MMQRFAYPTGTVGLDVRNVGMIAKEFLDSLGALSAPAGGEVTQYP
jgi:hypothetical protein